MDKIYPYIMKSLAPPSPPREEEHSTAGDFAQKTHIGSSRHDWVIGHTNTKWFYTFIFICFILFSFISFDWWFIGFVHFNSSSLSFHIWWYFYVKVQRSWNQQITKDNFSGLSLYLKTTILNLATFNICYFRKKLEKQSLLLIMPKLIQSTYLYLNKYIDLPHFLT